MKYQVEPRWVTTLAYAMAPSHQAASLDGAPLATNHTRPRTAATGWLSVRAETWMVLDGKSY